MTKPAEIALFTDDVASVQALCMRWPAERAVAMVDGPPNEDQFACSVADRNPDGRLLSQA